MDVDLRTFLDGQNMGKYIQLLKKNGVDKELFLSFVKEDLEYIGISDDDITVLLDMLESLRNKNLNFPTEITFSDDEVKVSLARSLKHVKTLHICVRFVTRLIHVRKLENFFTIDGRSTTDAIKHISDILTTKLTNTEANNVCNDIPDTQQISQIRKWLLVETLIVFVVADFVYLLFTNI